MGRKASFHRRFAISGGSCRLDRFRAHRCSLRAICLERRSEARATCRRAAVPMTVAARSAGENLLGWMDRSFRARMVSNRSGWMCEMLNMSWSNCSWTAWRARASRGCSSRDCTSFSVRTSESGATTFGGDWSWVDAPS
eukprot:scaffold8927_cov121-Isochrysis_galbana.AAC.1